MVQGNYCFRHKSCLLTFGYLQIMCKLQSMLKFVGEFSLIWLHLYGTRGEY